MKSGQTTHSILVTGAAGFIGFHVAKRLLQLGCNVLGVDSLNDYYSVQLKLDRLKQLGNESRFSFEKIQLSSRAEVEGIFKSKFEYVIHLAAEAGVKYSFENPYKFVESNLVGFINVLEECKKNSIKQLVYASSSSVYGDHNPQPWSEKDRSDQPISLYAATKKADELMAYSYGQMFGLRSVGLRFFNVYGPWGRPDMAIFKFTKAILDREPLDVFNFGHMKRDFSYIDDAVEAVVAVLERVIQSAGQSNDQVNSQMVSRLYNVGSGNAIDLLHLIEIIEKHVGAKATLNLLPMQPGDIQDALADISDLSNDYNLVPKVTITEGIGRFISWYQSYYSIKK